LDVPYNSGIYNDLVFIAAETTDEKEITEIELSYNVEANATDLGESKVQIRLRMLKLIRLTIRRLPKPVLPHLGPCLK
jgi:hypothetical protein